MNRPAIRPDLVHQFNSLTQGGAATAALRIARAVQAAGVETHFWHGAYESPVAEFPGGPLDYHKPHRLIYEWQRKKHYASHHAEIDESKVAAFTSPWSFNRPALAPETFGSGVLHLHWMGGNFLDYASFFSSIPDSQPIVWTLHDINPITGGCHLAGSCERFTQTCGSCPLINHPAPNDMTRRAMELKLRVLKGKNLHFVAPSHWMAGKIKASSVGQLAKSIRVIHNPVDTQAFSPIEPAQARQALGIDSPAPVIVFGANKLTEIHKGMHLLIEALLRLKGEMDFQLLVFGGAIAPELARSGIPYRHTGFISYPPFQRLVYSCADFYALPSLEDNSPQMGIEAMACGTPVVGFRTGGIPDFVSHGETGLLAPTGDTGELTLQIREALSNLPSLHQMRQKARAKAVALFESKQQGEKYRALYAEICR